MRFVAELFKNQEYRQRLQQLRKLEAERIYCCHDICHFMDVARLAQIRNLEENMQQDKEMIYLYALLHDMGRVAEYEQGISHAESSADYAGEILVHIGYPPKKTAVIQNAIRSHRSTEEQSASKGETLQRSAAETAGQTDTFAALMKWADKASRMCFLCKAQDTCKWSNDKKNKADNWM